MDLMKLLKLRTKEASDHETRKSLGSEFLRQLANLLKQDIAQINALPPQSPDEDWLRIGRNMKVYLGNLKERADPERDGYNYLFLHVPSKRGLMLELGEDGDSIEMRNGTMIVPLKRNVYEELEPSTLFVTAPQILGEFRMLAHDLLRERNEGKTFSLTSFSELLLSLAFGVTPMGQSQGPSKEDDLL